MNYVHKTAAVLLTTTAISSVGNGVGLDNYPQPVVLVKKEHMPAVPTKSSQNECVVTSEAIVTYHELRKAFDLSHTEMGRWLDVKRRSLYNWLDKPESSRKYGNQIEQRLWSLLQLKNEMEPEHWPILRKIANSPIYGDKSFAKSIELGANADVLIDWYEKLFDRFEAYRRSQKFDVA